MSDRSASAQWRDRARHLAGLGIQRARTRIPWRATGISLLAVLLLTILLQTLAGDLEVLDSALLYLVLVFGIALFFGSTPAVIGAIVAFLGLNLASVPPTGSLSIDSDEHLIALLVYLGIAGITGQLVAREAARSRQMERERARASLLEQSDELKTALLAAVSHELRSPLATIKASSSALLDRSVDWDEQSRQELLTAIDEEVDRLDRVVGNLLDLSRIEGGALRPNKEWCDVEELLRDVGRRLLERSATHPITISVRPELPLIHLDYVEISQVLMNLGDNALKYTPPGTPIHLAADVQNDTLVVTVHDGGPGIPEDDLARMFEPFWRADRSGRVGGTGIGLAISRGLVEAHGGTLSVKSTPGSGTTFTIRLPGGGSA